MTSIAEFTTGRDTARPTVISANIHYHGETARVVHFPPIGDTGQFASVHLGAGLSVLVSSPEDAARLASAFRAASDLLGGDLS